MTLSGLDPVGATAGAHTSSCKVPCIRQLDWGLGEEQSQGGPCLTRFGAPPAHSRAPSTVPGVQRVLSKASLLNSNNSCRLQPTRYVPGTVLGTSQR